MADSRYRSYSAEAFQHAAEAEDELEKAQKFGIAHEGGKSHIAIAHVHATLAVAYTQIGDQS